MRTKEEISKPFATKAIEFTHDTRVLSLSDAHKSMDEYAKEVAFNMWKLCNGYGVDYPMDDRHKVALWENLQRLQEKSSLK